MNPKVQSYLEKVKGRMKPAFDDGGLAPNPDGEIEALLAAEEEQHASDKEENKRLNALLQLSDAFRKHSVGSMQGEIQQAAPSDLGFQAPMSQYKPVELEKRPSVMKEALQKAQLMKQYKELKGGTEGMTAYQGASLKQKKDAVSYKKEQDALDAKQKTAAIKYKKEQDDLDNKFREKKFVDTVNARNAKSVGTGSSDPMSEASITSREEAKFLTGREFPESFSEAKINKIITALARKIESGYQKKKFTQSEKRLAQSEEKLALAKEKEIRQEKEQERNYEHKIMLHKRKISILSPKLAEKYVGIIGEQKYHDRIDRLFKFVATGKKQAYTELAKTWFPNANHDEAFVELQALSGQSLFAYIKEISGAQFSDAERIRFEDIMPGVKDNPKAAKAKLKAWKDTLNQKRTVFNIGLKAQGLDVPDLWAKNISVKETARTTKDGRTAIFDAETKKFLRYED